VALHIFEQKNISGFLALVIMLASMQAHSGARDGISRYYRKMPVDLVKENAGSAAYSDECCRVIWTFVCRPDASLLFP